MFSSGVIELFCVEQLACSPYIAAHVEKNKTKRKENTQNKKTHENYIDMISGNCY